MRYSAIRGIVEAGNCVYCGRHINDGGHIFLCEECRRKEEEGCLHVKQKEEATATARLAKSITVRVPKRKPTSKEEQLKRLKIKGGNRHEEG